MDLKGLRIKINQEKAKKEVLQSNLEKTIQKLTEEENYQGELDKALVIIQTVAKATQKKMEYHISNLVSMALAAVFPDPYEFILRFEERRNKTEADLLFSKDGHEGRPMFVSGGGPLDVAALALKVAVWSIKPTRNMMALDEPGKFISRDLQPKFSEMIKYLSTELNLQFIIVSHVPEITESADAVFPIGN